MNKIELHKLVNHVFDSYRNQRSALESEWIDHWTLYCPSAESVAYARSRYEQVIGEVGNAWRHRLSGTKTFVAVEQLFVLIFTGLFPVQYWIGLEPGVEVLGEEGDELDMKLRLLSRYIVQELEKSEFYTAFSLALRQLIITGTTIIEPYWENGLKFTTPNMFDVWIDPTQDNPNCSNVFRRVVFTPDDIREKIKDGTFNKISLTEFEERLHPTSDTQQITVDYANDVSESEKELISNFFSVSRNCTEGTTWWPVFEFWGKLYVDEEVVPMYIIFDSENLYMVQELDDDDERPFILSTYIPASAGIQPYGFSAVQPAKSLAMYLDKMLCQRLDGQELVINPAMGCVQDDVINPATTVLEPGSITRMAEAGNLFPIIQPNLANMSVNAQELQQISGDIDRSYGTVPGIGLSPQRSAERVTAEEVQTMRDAGGMRTAVYVQHIERTLLIPCISRIIELLAENAEPIEGYEEYVGIVGMPLNEDKVSYYGIKQQWIKYKSRIVVSGSRLLLQNNSILSGLERLLGFVSKSPEMMQHIDVAEAVRMYLRASQIPDPDRLLKKQQEQPLADPSTSLPMSASNDLRTQAQFDPEGMAAIGAGLTKNQKPLSSLVNVGDANGGIATS